jgi:hypothetical protein
VNPDLPSNLVLVSHERDRPELVLQAFHVLLTHHRPDARLYLVGPPPAAELREYARQLNLHGFAFTDDEPGDDAPTGELVLVGDSPLLTVEALLAGLDGRSR